MTHLSSKSDTPFASISPAPQPALASAPTLDTPDARLVALADSYEALARKVTTTSERDPEYSDLIAAFAPLEDEFAETPAATMTGVMAKARFLQVPAARNCANPELGNSLADDLIRLHADGALPALAVDPIVGLYQRKNALRAVHDRAGASVEDQDVAGDKIVELRHEAFDLRTTTSAGALTSLKWARDEFAEYYVEHQGKPDWLDLFTLKMMDNAIGVLRQVVQAGAAGVVV